MRINITANRLIALRNELGKSREGVARDLNISTSALIKYETGKRTPRDELKIKIANYYNTTVQDIFFNTNDTNSGINNNKKH